MNPLHFEKYHLCLVKMWNTTHMVEIEALIFLQTYHSSTKLITMLISIVINTNIEMFDLRGVRCAYLEL